LAFTYGEAAMIDTVQAKITLLQRITDFQQADIDRKVASLVLSNHLWTPNEEPLELADNVIPEEVPAEILNENLLSELVELARVNHPELRKLNLKNQSLLIDRKLARENLKPTLDFNYFLLNQPLSPEGESRSISFGDDYKLGLNFAFPIFLRKDRAKLNQTKYKIIGNNYELDFTERKIINDINGQFNAVVNTRNIMTQQQQMVLSYETILQAERLNLQNGESDLFKINIQIDKLIESQSKLLKLKSSYQKSIAQLYWAAGITNLGR
ncbi:MAG: TolC family protein, partial [Bacteroidota bacterium]